MKMMIGRGVGKQANLVAILLIGVSVLLVLPSTILSVGGPIQPPVDGTTLYSATIAWGPRRADPVRAYDVASGELLFNVYDTLISMGEAVTNYLGTWDTYESYWAFTPSLATNVPTREEVVMTFPDNGINTTDPTGYWFEPDPPDGRFYHIEGWVDNNPDGVFGSCDVIYVGQYLAAMQSIQEALSIRTWHVVGFDPGIGVTVHRFYYDFFMRTSPVIGFVNSSGVVVDTFDAYDAEYSFKRGLVQDQSASPMWMFYRSLFDQWNSRWLEAGGLSNVTASWFLALLIEDAIEILPAGNALRINFATAFPDMAFKQVLAQTWGSILSREWCIGKGCWNGNLFEDGDGDEVLDYYVQWRHVSSSPIQTVTPDNYAGTGPYRVTTASSADSLVVLERNPGYWKGWPASGRKSFLEKIQIDYVSDWTTRKNLFLSGQCDVCAVPRASVSELLDSYGEPVDPSIKTIKGILPTLSMDAVFYTWDVDNSYGALYTEVFPTGAPTDFMNNVHVRNAFSYSFNHSRYLHEVYQGEGICRETPGILGLVPDYYTKGQWTQTGGTGKFNYDLAKMEAELKQAFFVQDAENKSVWDWGGFHVAIYYYPPSRLTALDMIKEAFDSLNAASGKNFQITLSTIDPWWYDVTMTPVWAIGWLADYADADNFYRTYMHSYGDFSYFQHYPATTLGPRTGLNKDQLIDLAVKTPDGPVRADMYADLDDIYLADNPGFPIAQVLGRRWCRHWVKGWYYNALYPSQYYYHLYKEDACWADVSGSTVGVPDAKTDMRDVSYIAVHFGSKAPDTSEAQPYDALWAPGSYGCGGGDVYSDRRVDMRDVAFAAAHFLHEAQP